MLAIAGRWRLCPPDALSNNNKCPAQQGSSSLPRPPHLLLAAWPPRRSLLPGAQRCYPPPREQARTASLRGSSCPGPCLLPREKPLPCYPRAPYLQPRPPARTVVAAAARPPPACRQGAARPRAQRTEQQQQQEEEEGLGLWGV